MEPFTPPPSPPSNSSSGKMGAGGWAVFLGCIILAVAAAVSVRHFFLPTTPSQKLTPQFTGNMRQAMKTGLKDFDSKNPGESAKPMLQALDQEAKSGAPDAAAAGVMSQFTHDFQAITAVVSAAAKAAAAVPMPVATDPASYDPKIAADEAAIKAIREEMAYIQAIPTHIDEIAQSKNVPGLATDQMVIGFKSGVTKNLPLLRDYYAAMQKTYATGAEIFRLLKTNDGHWHVGAQGHRLLDDADAQKQYDALLADNTAANQQLAKYQAQLADIQKQSLQKTF